MNHIVRNVDIPLGRRVLVGILLDAPGVERRAALPVELLDARGSLKLGDDRSHVRAAVGDGQLRVPRLRDGLGIVDLPHPRPNRQPIVAIDNSRHSSRVKSIHRFFCKDRYIFTGHAVTDMRIAAQFKRRAPLRQQRRRVGDGRVHIRLADHAPERLRRAVDVCRAAVDTPDVQLVHALAIAQRIKARRKVRVEDLLADLLHVSAVPQLRRVGIVRPHDVQRPRITRRVRRNQRVRNRLNELEQRRKQSFARKTVLIKRRKVAAPQLPARRLLARQHLPDTAFQWLPVAADLHVGRRDIVRKRAKHLVAFELLRACPAVYALGNLRHAEQIDPFARRVEDFHELPIAERADIFRRHGHGHARKRRVFELQVGDLRRPQLTRVS